MFGKTDISQEATKAANFYCCTSCDERRSYKNISEWRRHEKGHEDTYVCMLGRPVDETEGDVRCSLCGTPNPSEAHLGAHNTQLCGRGVLGSFSCKRRADMVRHLKVRHNVHEKAQGEAVADKWKDTTKKQAWSCGFCVHLFHTFGDRLKHIAKHFENGQTLDGWDTTNVIEGLLRQPGMVNVWKMPLGWRSSTSIWIKDVVKTLQHDLELGPVNPTHATALAERVYNARQPDWQMVNNYRSLTFAPINGALALSALAPTGHHDSKTRGELQPSLDYEQSHFINSAETLRNGVSKSDGDLMVTYDDSSLPVSFSDEDSASVKDPWPLNSGQTWSSAAHPCIGYSVNQEHSNATAGRNTWSTPAVFSDDPNASMLMQSPCRHLRTDLR